MSIVSPEPDNFNPLDWALWYASLGHAVIPNYSHINGYCTCGGRPNCRPGKHPACPHGYKDASTDPEQLRRWFDIGMPINIGIPTGVTMWVLDTDRKSGGLATLAQWEAEFGALPVTPRARTGGDGWHYCFAPPTDGRVVPSRSGIAPGIDTRGLAGQIIAPPSSHISGNRYAWDRPLTLPLAPAPEWLLAKVCEKPKPTEKPNPTPAKSSTIFIMGGSDEDLDSHPGEIEGKRNDTLCRLIGKHVARGESLTDIVDKALDWAERCNPPCQDDGKILATVQNIYAKHHAKAEAEAEAKADDHAQHTHPVKPEQEQEPTPDDWPTLNPDAYYGLAGDIVRAIEPETEADPVGVLTSLLAAISVAIGNGSRFAVGAKYHHANLFLALVGDTACGKGDALGYADTLMAKVDEAWNQCIAYGLSSGEGLVDRVKDPEMSDYDGMFRMPPQRKLLCHEEELIRPITAMRREGNTLSAILRCAWDGNCLEVNTKGKSRAKASNAHIGILAHITPEEFKKVFSGSVETSNGFANRFLWILVRSEKCLPTGGNASVLDPFVERLKQALEYARQHRQMSFAPEAEPLWAEAYPMLKASMPGAWGKATDRARPQTLRLAMLYALLDQSDTIRPEHLRAALAIWKYAEESARRLFSPEAKPDTAEPLANRLLGLIRAKPGIHRSELCQAMPSNRRKGVGEALDYLHKHGLAYCVPCQASAGRPAECWFPGTPEPEPKPEPEQSPEPKPEQSPEPEQSPPSQGGGEASKPKVAGPPPKGIGTPKEWLEAMGGAVIAECYAANRLDMPGSEWPLDETDTEVLRFLYDLHAPEEWWSIRYTSDSL